MKRKLKKLLPSVYFVVGLYIIISVSGCVIEWDLKYIDMSKWLEGFRGLYIFLCFIWIVFDFRSD